MTATSSNSGEWQTPPWLVAKCRAMLGGYITLDAATSPDNPVGASTFFTAEQSAFDRTWDTAAAHSLRPTLFLNPPGERTGKLIRRFWAEWHYYSTRFFRASCWVDFNLDHLRFIERVPGDVLIVPRKRLAFVDPATGLERKGAQIGGFILFRGWWTLSVEWPDREYLVMPGQD